MTTIANRLREIAEDIPGLAGNDGREDTVEALRALAAELESAPAADSAMPAYGTITWDALVAAVGEANGSAFEVDQTYYVGHQMCVINMNSLNRIVSKFVAALQAQIAELEARQVPDGSAPITREKLAELIQEGFMAGAKHGAEAMCLELASKGMLASAPNKPAGNAS